MSSHQAPLLGLVMINLHRIRIASFQVDTVTLMLSLGITFPLGLLIELTLFFLLPSKL